MSFARRAKKTAPTAQLSVQVFFAPSFLRDDSTLAMLGQSVGCICLCLHRTLGKTASETEITPLGIISSISEVSDVM